VSQEKIVTDGSMSLVGIVTAIVLCLGGNCLCKVIVFVVHFHETWRR
jgi:hypothetical protein